MAAVVFADKAAGDLASVAALNDGWPSPMRAWYTVIIIALVSTSTLR